MLNEFKKFAIKGNVIDMAVGIIIGGAFGKIVASLVKDILMPPLGLLIAGSKFGDMRIILKQATIDPTTNMMNEAVAINYGQFIITMVDFTIIALAIFAVVKIMNSLKKKEEAAPSEPPKPSNQEVLLTEIRDLLKKK